MDPVIQFLQRASSDDTKTEEVLKSCIGLVGDLADCFGPRMRPIMAQPFVVNMLQEGSQYEEMTTLVQWVREVSRTVDVL